MRLMKNLVSSLSRNNTEAEMPANNSLRWTVSGILALTALMSSTTDASAQQRLEGSGVLIDGGCGDPSPTTFFTTVVSFPTQFTTTDETIVPPVGPSQTQDVVILSTTDANNVIIGRTAQGFPTTTDLFNQTPFSVQQRPTVTGNFTVRLADEADRTPDRALGSTYMGVF